MPKSKVCSADVPSEVRPTQAVSGAVPPTQDVVFERGIEVCTTAIFKRPMGRLACS